MSQDFIASQMDRLADFWRRRESAPSHAFEDAVCGYPYRVAANHPDLLAAARLSARRYSRCAPVAGGRPIALHYIHDTALPDEPLPVDWPRRLRTMGLGDWLAVNAEPWVNAFADLAGWVGVAFVSAPLMRAPYLLSRFVGDCFTLNMLLRTGWGQLHASCLWRDGRAVLLAAPHNTGKSTAAFRLAMNGYRLVSDGMTYVRAHGAAAAGEAVELFGYPVGEVKLRFDMLGEFPQLRGGESMLVREDRKMIYDLRREMPERVVEESVRPREIAVCLLERSGARETVAEPIDREAALLGLWPEASHLDDMGVMAGNLRSIEALLERARCYRLMLGSGAPGIVRVVDALL